MLTKKGYKTNNYYRDQEYTKHTSTNEILFINNNTLKGYTCTSIFPQILNMVMNI